MSGWQTKRVELAAPYEGRWVEVYEDPPLGLYLELRRLLRGMPDEKSLDRALSLVRQMVADHNLVGPDDERLDTWSTQTVGGKLVRELTNAINSVIEGGESADPLTPTNSPSTSSKVRRSRRTSASGSSPAR